MFRDEYSLRVNVSRIGFDKNTSFRYYFAKREITQTDVFLPPSLCWCFPLTDHHIVFVASNNSLLVKTSTKSEIM